MNTIQKRFACVLAFALLVFAAIPARAQRQAEPLGRGVIVMRKNSTQAYVGWRLFATDPDDTGFNVLRAANGAAAIQLNSALLTNTTDFLDTSVNFAVSNAWFIQPVINGSTQALSAPWGLAANPPSRQYFSVPLHNVDGGTAPPYDVKFCWVGDFDGDGEYDFLVDRLSTTSGAANEYLQAYKRDGTFLWQMDMGYNSTNQANAYEPGASAISIGDKDNVTVFDLDGDGRAEVIVRTARGVVLPDGTTISGADDTTQYLSILDGLTGKERARATIPNPYFADGPLNCHAFVMYLDGVRPSVVFDGENRVGSGAFQRLAVAWDFRNGQLTQRWLHQAGPGENDSRGHQVRIADVNHDGKDDLVEIGCVLVGPNATPLYSTELLHGDRYHVTDIDPDRPGLEMYAIQQLNSSLLATALQDMSSGQLFKKWYSAVITDVGRGVTLDMDPTYRGCELYSTQPGIFDRKGNQIFANNIWAPEGVWWDADLSREFEDGAGSGALSPVINKFNHNTGGTDRLYSIYPEGVHQAYGGRAAFWGDIEGDWREELVLVANDYSEIRVYGTTISATNRLYCLMQNPQYRCQCTAKGYYQASYVDYFLGTGMQPPAPPTISDARLVWRGNGTNNWDSATANWFTNNLWISNTVATTFTDGDTVLFDLTGSNNSAIHLTGSLQPGWVMVQSPKDYTFDGVGSLDGAMKVTKAGAGKLTFNGTNNYNGRTLIAEGPFVVNGLLPNSAVTVRGGVWLDGRLGGVGVVASPVTCEPGGGISPGAGTNSPGTLTISNSVTLWNALSDFDLSDDASGLTKSNDLLVVSGNLVLQGTNTFTIRKLNATLPPGVYPLVQYSGALSGGLNNLALAGLDGAPAALTNSPGQIALVIKSTREPSALVWTGGQNGNAWDLATSSNFLNSASKDVFVPGDSVRFDNVGSSNLTVNLNDTLLASDVVVDSTANYTLTGTGGIGGSGGLTKTNSGTLTIAAKNNSFTGRTLISGGTVVVSELDAVGYPSPLGNSGANPTNLVMSGSSTLRVTGESYTDRGMTLNAGTNSIEILNAADQVTIANQIVGSGALQKLGPGTLALSTNNTFSGGLVIKSGIVSLGSVAGNVSGPGTGTVTLDGGRLSMIDLQASENAAWPIYVPTNSTGWLDCDGRCTLSGALTGGGALTVWIPYVRTDFGGNWSAFTGQLLVTTDSGGGNFRCNNSAGYPLAKMNLAGGISLHNRVSGTPTISIGELSGAAGSYISAPGGNDGIAVNWRVGGLDTSATYAGAIMNSVGFVKIGTGTWTLTGTNSNTGQITITNGTLQVGSGGTLGNLGTGGISVSNNATLAFNRSDFVTDTNLSVISGGGNLAKRGAGRLELTKAHTYIGVTSVEAGTLALTGSGSIAGSTNVVLSSGALLDVSGTTSGSMKLGIRKTISGFGSVKGNFLLDSRAFLSPGTGNLIGTLTFSNGLYLFGQATAAPCSNFFKISKSPTTNDVVRVFGTLTNGGVLVVTNIGANVLAAGDTFRLFNAASYTGAFESFTLPLLPSGLMWDTRTVNTNGTIKVVAIPTPVIGGAALSSTSLVVTGGNGLANSNYYVLTSTNISLPRNQWIPMTTGRFDANGNFAFTNGLNSVAPQQFYLLQLP